MKLGVLFSGGKDSTYAGYLAKEAGHDITCLISLHSKNKDSYMFHTPTIELTNEQANLMNIPLIIQETKGEKEKELEDLKKAIKKAIKEFSIKGIVTGAVESVYQSSRIQRICNELGIECFNPLWQKDQIELLNELIKDKFKIIISSVAAYPLDKTWIGKTIDKKLIEELRKLQEKYKINPAGEGGEFESLVINCPLFKKELKLPDFKIIGEGNSWRREVKLD